MPAELTLEHRLRMGTVDAADTSRIMARLVPFFADGDEDAVQYRIGQLPGGGADRGWRRHTPSARRPRVRHASARFNPPLSGDSTVTSRLRSTAARREANSGCASNCSAPQRKALSPERSGVLTQINQRTGHGRRGE
ncbi:MAG: hypothetical protein ACYCZD_02045 [Rhodanobacter sp.]